MYLIFLTFVVLVYFLWAMILNILASTPHGPHVTHAMSTHQNYWFFFSSRTGCFRKKKWFACVMSCYRINKSDKQRLKEQKYGNYKTRIPEIYFSV